ncbi:MAG TPA: radical SAM protein [Candidatus Saccharimonadales bacterium]|nr:radical SAM protein [Candidatus Saccharimonadales bacterium]
MEIRRPDTLSPETNAAEQELKLRVFAEGVEIDSGAEQIWRDLYEDEISLNEYASTAGACLVTENGTYISAPYIQDFTRDTSIRLIHDEGFKLVDGDAITAVDVFPIPAYHKRDYMRPDGTVLPYTNLGVTHTDRVRISPIEGCAWRCTFCDLPYKFRYQKKPEEELLRVIELAKDDELTPARHVLISGGTPKETDEAWMDSLYEYICSESPLPVDIMMPARSDKNYPRWLGSIGMNQLSVNIEVFDRERARRITPFKARTVGETALKGIDHYLDYIEGAVEQLGVGRVQSLIVFGEAIESEESTLAGVQALAERGAIPVLSPYRPDASTPLGKKDSPPASYEETKRVYEASLEICDKASGGVVKPGPRCVPCQHNTVTFDDGSDFYIPLGTDIRTPLNARPS